MKTIFIVLLFFFSLFFGIDDLSQTNSRSQDMLLAKQTSYVLICKSENAYAYHTHYCSGLKNCKSNILKLSISNAIHNGYKACRNCY